MRPAGNVMFRPLFPPPKLAREGRPRIPIRGPRREALSRPGKALSGCPAAVPLPTSPASGRGDFASPSVFRMPFLHRIPPRSVPFAPPPARQAGPCFARIACGRGRVFAPARFARLIAPACARPRNQGAPLPSVPLESFSRRREAAPRMPLPLLHISTDFQNTSPLRELIQK